MGFASRVSEVGITDSPPQVVGAALPVSIESRVQEAAIEAAIVGMSPDIRYKSSLEGEESKLPRLQELHLLGGTEQVASRGCHIARVSAPCTHA